MNFLRRPKIEQPFPVGTADRRTYLGGTDASAIVGWSRYRTPLHVWGEKTGLIEPDQTETLPQKLGKRLEEVVAELFTLQTGKKVRRVNETLFHEKHPFLGANIDRRVVGEDTILECKTAAPWKAKEFQGEELPPEHIIQVVHYLAVTGARRAYLAVLIGNQDFVVRTIERDENMIANLVGQELKFWNEFVVPQVMPKVVARDAEALAALFPEAKPGSVVQLDDQARQTIEILEAMKQDAANLDAQIEEKKNELKKMLGNAEAGAVGDWFVTWKNQKAARVDSKALKEMFPDVAQIVTKESVSRVLRTKKLEVI